MPAAVGVMLPRDLPARDAIAFARRADALGFDELWVVEDLGFRGGVAQAAAVLGVTDRITVGIGILPVGARNVAYCAMELATLAQLFPGRVVVGVGHGMPAWLRSVGVWPESPLGLLHEYLLALRGLLRGETVMGEGRYVRLAGVGLDPIAVPDVVPPLLAGVRGPRSLALAGSVADGVVLAEPAAPAYIRAALAAGVAGRIVAYNAAAVADDERAALDAVRPALEWVGDPEWAAHITPLPFGRRLAELRARCSDRADFTRRIPAEWVPELAICGTARGVRARLGELFDAGASSAVLIPVGPEPLRALTALAGAL